MSNPTMKTIFTPEYKRLRPMKRVGGPVMGPTEPSRVPIEIVRDCLLQDDAPIIKEVIQVGTDQGKPVWSDPIELTLENYMLPYSKIAGIDLESIMQKEEASVEAAPVVEEPAPVVEEVPAEETVVEAAPIVEETLAEEPAPVAEEVPAEEPVVNEEKGDEGAEKPQKRGGKHAK